MLPVDPSHRENRRDDDFVDFLALKAQGLVRNKSGRVIPIEKPHYDFTPLDRDSLYQDYCGLMRDGPNASPDFVRSWLHQRVAHIHGASGRTMSLQRARDIINEGNGQYPGHNMQWWRGLST